MCLAVLTKLNKLSLFTFLLRFSKSKNKAAPTKRIQSGMYWVMVYVINGVGVWVLTRLSTAVLDGGEGGGPCLRHYLCVCSFYCLVIEQTFGHPNVNWGFIFSKCCPAKKILN